MPSEYSPPDCAPTGNGWPHRANLALCPVPPTAMRTPTTFPLPGEFNRLHSPVRAFNVRTTAGAESAWVAGRFVLVRAAIIGTSI